MKEFRQMQVKICGLTRIEDARGCLELGADALGFVFFPKSPRHLSDENAKEIIRHLPVKTKTIGVFVNEPFSVIMRKVAYCGLSGVQLHGQENPDLVFRLANEGLLVIKALFVGATPCLEDGENYTASAYLVEPGKGSLPGGNALQWNYGDAKGFGSKQPLILAGGLTSDNVLAAIDACLPAAIDVSSGVEKSPGIKDLKKVRQFMDAVSRWMPPPGASGNSLRIIF